MSRVTQLKHEDLLHMSFYLNFSLICTLCHRDSSKENNQNKL